jgi:hypothetical protein
MDDDLAIIVPSKKAVEVIDLTGTDDEARSEDPAAARHAVGAAMCAAARRADVAVCAADGDATCACSYA